MAEECKNCVHKSNFKAVECGTCTVDYFDGVQQGLPTNYKARPMTNADRIRAMTDEELSEDYCEFLESMLKKLGVEFDFDMDKAKSIMLKYLQQPAEVD